MFIMLRILSKKISVHNLLFLIKNIKIKLIDILLLTITILVSKFTKEKCSHVKISVT